MTTDVDLLIVSDQLTYADLVAALDQASVELGRSRSDGPFPTELSTRVAQDNAFVRRVVDGPNIWLIDDERALAA